MKYRTNNCVLSIFVILFLITFGSSAQTTTKQDSVLTLECPELDSIVDSKIKHGFYFRILEKIDEHDEFYNQIEWVQIDENNRVRTFLTANFEYCMLDMYFAEKPKAIKRQIKHNKEKFEKLYLECSEGQAYVPSLVKGNRIVLNSVKGDIIYPDTLIFTKNGLVRILRSYHDCDMYEYNY